QLAARERELAAAVEREAALNRTVAERDNQLMGLQEHLKTEFKNIASDVLRNATDQLSEKSRESLTPVLDPLKVQIKEFNDRVESSHKEDIRDRSALIQQ